jgi:hypothetical protein
MAMEPGEFSGVIETFNAIVVIQMTHKDELDNDKYLESYAILRENLLQAKRALGYTSWLTDARKSIEKEDYRSEVY